MNGNTLRYFYLAGNWTRHTDSGMGSVWKCCVVAVVCYGISSFALDYQSQPGRGFQFNCGQDLCSFPHQYCDTDDYRCLYCSDDLCLSKDLPDQCTSYCKGNHIVIWIIIINFQLLGFLFFCSYFLKSMYRIPLALCTISKI